MLRCSQAHLQVAQANIKFKTCKRACLPKRTDRNYAAKMKDRKTNKKNGQLVTGVCCQWRVSASFDSDLNIETSVLRGKFRNKIATEQQPPVRYRAL